MIFVQGVLFIGFLGLKFQLSGCLSVLDRLSHSDLSADLKSGCRLDAVEAAEGVDGSAVVDGDAAKGVTRLDGVPAHCLSFGILFLVVLLVLYFIVEILLVVTVDIEILLLQDEESVTEKSVFKVYKPLRVKGEAVISRLEMEMRAG